VEGPNILRKAVTEDLTNVLVGPGFAAIYSEAATISTGRSDVKEVLRVPGAVAEEGGQAGVARPPAPTESADATGRARRWNWIDEALADSFPASDPPSWTPGVARLDPISAGRGARHG
jgi:hypothetical protein